MKQINLDKMSKRFFLQKRLAFFLFPCYYVQAVWNARHKSKEYPGVAKFGIALEWGSRGPEFESQHSDQ